MVMTGMRVQVGTQAIERAPSYIEIFGRTMQLNLTRSRWFDFPFTREEALQADKKLSIFSKSPTDIRATSMCTSSEYFGRIYSLLIMIIINIIIIIIIYVFSYKIS